jgi:hypothetical protein
VPSLGTAVRSSMAAAQTLTTGRGGAELGGSSAELGWHEAGEVSTLETAARSSGAAVQTSATEGGAARDRRR